MLSIYFLSFSFVIFKIITKSQKIHGQFALYNFIF